MTIDRAGALIDLLRQHQFLEPAQLEELSRTPDLQDTDAGLLGQCLVELRWLTPFQVDRLCRQRPQDLILGPYQLLDRLGQGETGPAFQARKPGKPGTVALKIIPKARLADPQLLARFQQEVRVAAQLQHPFLAPVTAVGQQGNLFLFAREFVEGIDLGRLVRESGPLPVGRACNAVRQAALALQCGHDKGLSHRRVKPSNVIVVGQPGPEASAKLVDFGLGQLQGGSAGGLDVAADLEGLGKTLSFLLNGEAPAEVGEIVRRLSPTAVDRFATAREVASALEPLCYEPPPAPPPVSANGTDLAPASAPLDIPIATAAVEAVSPLPELHETPASLAMAEVVSEEIATPAMETVAVAVEEMPLAVEEMPLMEGPSLSAPEMPMPLAAPIHVEAIAAVPAPAPTADLVAEDMPALPSEGATNTSLIELLGTGMAGEKPDDDWPLEKHSGPSEAVPEPVAVSSAPEPVPPPAMGSFLESVSASPPDGAAAVSEPIPSGYFADQSSAVEEGNGFPMSAAAMAASPRRAPAKKKWSRSSIIWLTIGALLHLVAAVILVVVIMAMMKREEPPQKPLRPSAPAKSKAKSQARSRDDRSGLSLSFRSICH